ncbi:MAG: MaoC family dehydratase [Deltaproteobacteria bacterium]|jgi:3-hydroxybutyryl-CoA dehydratase|nr:MaoC family dehydratase [Deltaproteobacteria bacterium]
MATVRRGFTYAEINVGDAATFTKTITESDVQAYTGITGDFNAAHVDDVYMHTSRLGLKMQGRIAHGMLTAGLFSTVLGNYLPGKGTLYLSQTCVFRRPVKLGDTVTARGEVVEKLEKNKIRLKMTGMNQRGELVIEGEALVTAADSIEDTM